MNPSLDEFSSASLITSEIYGEEELIYSMEKLRLSFEFSMFVNWNRKYIAFSRLVRYNSYLLLFSNILIMKPHSIAFRQKIIEVHEAEDISQRKLAKRFNVALSFIQKLLKQYRETDSLAPKVRTQQTPAKLNNEHLTVLRRLVEERNDATLEELRKQLIHETGIDVSRSTIDRALNKLGLTLKKRRSMLTRRKLSESSLSV
jgi:transposase